MASLKEFVRQLKADCSTVEATVLHRHLATADECRAAKPGGAENAERGPRGWLSYYRWLHRRHAAHEQRDGPVARGSEREEGLALETLRSAPVPVVLIQPVDERTQVILHPKGLAALIHCHRLSLRLGWLSAHLRTLTTSSDLADREAVQYGWGRAQRLLQQFLWITTHPGPGMPFAAYEDPDPPAWTAVIDPVDVKRALDGFQRLHLARLSAIDRLVTPDPDGAPRSVSWSVFAVSAAEELGISTSELMEEIDLPAAVARVRLRAQQERDAMAEAKRRAEVARSQSR